jgi:hypothetical protein
MSDPHGAAPLGASLTSQFQLAAQGIEARSRPKPPPPFSLRLTARERARLEELAGSQPLGAYVRTRLFGEESDKRRMSRRPRVDEQKLAMVLAELGRSRLAQNMNQIAKAANTGTLDATPELTLDLQDACKTVRILRETLMAALGLRLGNDE